jgi:AcrR family transcriptional regulator
MMKDFHTLPHVSRVFARHPRPERRDAMEHRQRILEVARHLFAEQGVDAVSMHQIAMAAGVGQGTLYRRYANKGELCIYIMREQHERFIEKIATLLTMWETTPALERLDGVLSETVAFVEEGALLGPVATGDMRKIPCDAADLRRLSLQHAPLYQWLQALLIGLLGEAVAREELPSLDVPYTADAILATLHPIIYSLQRQERGFSPERILQGLRRIYIDGIKTPRPASGL